MYRSFLLVTAASAAVLSFTASVYAEEETGATGATANVEIVTVAAQKLSEARADIQTQLGASAYTITAKDIQNTPGADNALLSQVLLQMPGVVQDSFGQLHIRGEHNALQYRINGIVLPEGISVFGQTLDPRLASSVELLTGALPAEYGLATGGVVDIQTKTGLFNAGGHVSIYGGSHNEIEPSFDYGGSTGHLNYFVAGDYQTNSLGIEAPTNSFSTKHDRTKQYHGFAYLQYILDEHSSVTAILGTSNDMFQIPNQIGTEPSGIGGIVGFGPLDPGGSGNYLLQAKGQTSFLSQNQDERQREITHYATVSYLHSAGALTYQVSVFGRYSSLNFTPGANVGDILFNGIAQTAYKRDEAYGLQAEGAYHLGDSHTIRFGTVYEADDLVSNTSSLVLPVAQGSPTNPNPNPLCTDPANTCQTSDVPLNIIDNGNKHASSYSFYLQDEWKVFENLTINTGVRYDKYQAYSHGDQFSPRLNAVWTPWDDTIVHAGYARYFSPPPIELVSGASVALFNNTTNSPAITTDTTPIAERADYYDVGVSQQITPEWNVGLDTYYKLSKNLIDEGQFGAPIILTPFNYARGRQYGAVVTVDYTSGDFSAYANYSLERSRGEDWITSEFNFNPDEFAYVHDHFISLDHEQKGTASAGMAYRWGLATFSTDMIYGTGLRQGLMLPSGQNIPNGDHVPAYVQVNLGASRDLTDVGLDGLTARVDVINLFDVDYQIRSGSGVGVFAPQFAQRRGFFFGLSKAL